MTINKIKKKELLKKYINDQKDDFEKSLPFSKDLFEKLLDTLDERLEIDGCDDILKYTIKFLKENKLPLENAISWLNENGGYCDCEVLANTEYRILD